MVHARVGCETLRLVFCPGLFDSDRQSFDADWFRAKVRHVAEADCRKAGVKVLIETLDCSNHHLECLRKMVDDLEPNLLIIPDMKPKNPISALLNQTSTALVKKCQCSVLLVR